MSSKFFFSFRNKNSEKNADANCVTKGEDKEYVQGNKERKVLTVLLNRKEGTMFSNTIDINLE